MMKKCLLLFLLFTTFLGVFSQSKVKIKKPEKKFTGWSFSLEGGYNMFDGDITQDYNGIFPTSTRTPSIGGTVEYALTPIWGLALDFYNFPLSADYISYDNILKKKTILAHLNTNLYTSNVNATINFTRWIFPETKSKFYIFGSVGLGMAYYIYDVTPKSYQVPDTFGIAVSIPVTFSAEYNFSKTITAGLRIHYRAHNKDNLEGIKQLTPNKGVTNDFIGAGQLYVRYKLHVLNKKHKRNITMSEYEPNVAVDISNKNAEDIKLLGAAIKKLENRVDTIAKRVDSIAGILAVNGPDTDGDGVPDSRDRDPNTPRNTPVDFWGKSTLAPPVANIVNNNNTNTSVTKTIYVSDDIPAVYFDFDRIDLDDDALVTIQKISARMKADPNLYVEVRGYCDYMGVNPYNNLLSQRRSDRVKAEMVKMWKIPADHIIANGKGKAIEPRIKYRPNRRCDFFFGKL
jgi:outer membrane protein OmpA-like peptidoglycan-associated protein